VKVTDEMVYRVRNALSVDLPDLEVREALEAALADVPDGIPAMEDMSLPVAQARIAELEAYTLALEGGLELFAQKWRRDANRADSYRDNRAFQVLQDVQMELRQKVREIRLQTLKEVSGRERGTKG
jgi:hypothetical protein